LARLTLALSANYIDCVLPIGTASWIKKRYGEVPTVNWKLSMFVGFNWINNDKVFKSYPNTIRSRCRFTFLLFFVWRRLNFINLYSTNKTEVPFIDLNNLRFLKLITLIIFCDLKEQIFETTLQEAIMIC
jgi:hypothetical protein